MGGEREVCKSTSERERGARGGGGGRRETRLSRMLLMGGEGEGCKTGSTEREVAGGGGGQSATEGVRGRERVVRLGSRDRDRQK